MPAFHQRLGAGSHSMDNIEKEALRKNRVRLSNDLLVEEILPYLVDYGLFTDHMVDCVMSHRTRLQKVQQLLSDLPRRGPEAYPLFIEALVHSGQKHLADNIQKTERELRLSAPQTNYGYRNSHSAPTYRNYGHVQPQSAIFQPPPSVHSSQPHPGAPYPPQPQNVGYNVSQGRGIVAQPVDDRNSMAPPGEALRQRVKQEPGLSQQGLACSEEQMSVDENLSSRGQFHAGASYFAGSVNMEAAASSPPGGVIPGQSAQIVDLKNIPETRSRFTGNVQRNEVLPVNDPEDEHIYKMTSKPRGYALIINNRYFHGSSQLSERLGTDVDRDNLRNVLITLNYEVTVFDNMKGMEMESAVKRFSERDQHKDVDSAIVVLLSHGEDGKIFGIDCVPVHVDMLIKYFDGAHCPKLIGKPKMFVIQACRGRSFNPGFETVDGPGGQQQTSGDAAGVAPGPSTRSRQSGQTVGPAMIEQLQTLHLRDTENLRKKLPEGADMLIAYATVPGYVSWRNSERGSWFVQELCTVLYQYAHKEDLLSMMTIVNNKVATAYRSACDNKQMPAPVTTLRKKWYFYPRM